MKRKTNVIAKFYWPYNYDSFNSLTKRKVQNKFFGFKVATSKRITFLELCAPRL